MGVLEASTRMAGSMVPAEGIEPPTHALRRIFRKISSASWCTTVHHDSSTYGSPGLSPLLTIAHHLVPLVWRSYGTESMTKPAGERDLSPVRTVLLKPIVRSVACYARSPGSTIGILVVGRRTSVDPTARTCIQSTTRPCVKPTARAGIHPASWSSVQPAARTRVKPTTRTRVEPATWSRVAGTARARITKTRSRDCTLHYER